MSARAYTLIECMVAVAIIGIFAAIAMVANQAPLYASEDVLVRERARQWAEYEADVVVAGVPGDAAIREQLRAFVPRGALERTVRNGLTQLTVKWRRADGRDAALTLVVVGAGGAP